MKKFKILIILFIIVFSIFIIIQNNIVKKANNLHLKDIDFNNFEDGIYKGYYKLSPVKVELDILIADSKIKNIDIVKHDNGFGKNAESILTKVISEQSLDVDSIAGSTVSSKVILKAIENAFIKR